MKPYRKIHISQLCTGMTIVRADRSGVKFPYYGSPLKDIKAVDILKEQGVKSVVIKIDPNNEEVLERLRQLDKLGHADKEAVPAAPEQKVEESQPSAEEELSNEELEKSLDIDDFDLDQVFKQVDEMAEGKIAQLSMEDQRKLDGLNEVKEIHERARKEVKKIFKQMKMGYELDLTMIRGLVSEFVLYGLNEPEILANSVRLKYDEDYLYTHSVNVCIISVSIGIKLKMSPRDINWLGLSAILHDIGMIKISDSIINKPMKLTKQEFDLMKKHPDYSMSMLENDTTIKMEILRGVLQHHERLDGSGYPSGFKGAQISKFGLIIGLADVYDAMTSEKKYRSSISKYEALKNIFEMAGKHFHPVLVKALVSLVGALPIETFLRLSTGEYGVVFELNSGNPNLPRVLVFRNAEGFKSIPRVVDLLEEKKDGIFVKEVLDPKKHDVNPSEIINSFLEANKS